MIKVAKSPRKNITLKTVGIKFKSIGIFKSLCILQLCDTNTIR